MIGHIEGFVLLFHLQYCQKTKTTRKSKCKCSRYFSRTGSEDNFHQNTIPKKPLLTLFSTKEKDIAV